MHTVTLSLADNGIIKSVIDDNINAAGESYESVTVYDFESKDANDVKIKFLNDIAMDSGLELGNPSDKYQIKIIQDWGTSYIPTAEEVSLRIQEYKLEIRKLEMMLTN
jgi:hypothetical protein